MELHTKIVLINIVLMYTFMYSSRNTLRQNKEEGFILYFTIKLWSFFTLASIPAWIVSTIATL